MRYLILVLGEDLSSNLMVYPTCEREVSTLISFDEGGREGRRELG